MITDNREDYKMEFSRDRKGFATREVNSVVDKVFDDITTRTCKNCECFDDRHNFNVCSEGVGISDINTTNFGCSMFVRKES